MPLIPEETLERIRDAADIVDVVSEHVQLGKKGRNFFGLCPFHDEKSPSFSVNPDRQIYHCFGCGVGGNVFRFIQEVDRVTFVEAVKYLSERTGISLPERSDSSRDETEAADLIYRANDLAYKYFHHRLLNDDSGGAAREYLQARHLTRASPAFCWFPAPAPSHSLPIIRPARALPRLAARRSAGAGHAAACRGGPP